MKSYDAIINLPHHVSTKHPQMSNYNRAVQFSPFAALTGYKEAIDNETAKISDDNTSFSFCHDIKNKALKKHSLIM